MPIHASHRVQSISAQDHWDDLYRAGPLPWETDRPSSELRRVMREYDVRPCCTVEIGCGTGRNAIWVAGQGFAVTAVDVSAIAIRKARQRSRKVGANVRFLVGDVTKQDCYPNDLEHSVEFFFDRGCYHAVRIVDDSGYHRSLRRIIGPGAFGLVLMGNSAEAEDRDGPPVVDEEQIRGEWGREFEIVHLRPFRFDPRRPGDKRYLGWSCALRG